MDTAYLILKVLLLLLAANGGPILANKMFKEHWAYPVDGGKHLQDGQPLFGASKTWRGLLIAIAATALMAWLLREPVWLGGLFGLLAMLGDLLASFIKRRRKLPPSSMATGLDQVPEALLPTVITSPFLQLNGFEIGLTVIMFFFFEIMFSPILYRWKIRQRPY